MIVNASSLERGLYLLSELLILGPLVAVALNMIDVAETQGIRIDVEALQKSLNIPVVSMVATKNKGLKELIATAISLAKAELIYHPNLPGASRIIRIYSIRSQNLSPNMSHHLIK
jgi:ferrous iron transport protein B